MKKYLLTFIVCWLSLYGYAQTYSPITIDNNGMVVNTNSISFTNNSVQFSAGVAIGNGSTNGVLTLTGLGANSSSIAQQGSTLNINPQSNINIGINQQAGNVTVIGNAASTLYTAAVLLATNGLKTATNFNITATGNGMVGGVNFSNRQLTAVGSICTTNNGVGSPAGVVLTTNGTAYISSTLYVNTLSPISGTSFSISGGVMSVSSGASLNFNSGSSVSSIPNCSLGGMTVTNGAAVLTSLNAQSTLTAPNTTVSASGATVASLGITNGTAYGTFNGSHVGSGFSITNIQSSNIVQNAIINYQNFNTWDPNAGGSHVTPTVCPNSGDAHGAIRGYQINAGSTYAQGWCWQNGDYFGTKTNFQLIAEVWVTNTYTVTNMSFTEDFIDKQGRDVFYNNPNASPSVIANQMNYITNTFSINPTNAGNIAQITFFAGYGSTASWLSTWWISYRLIGY